MSLCCSNFICRCISWIVCNICTIIIILGAAALAIYIKIHPKLPSYSVQEVFISTLSVQPMLTPTNGGVGNYYDAFVNMDILFVFEAVNPNKKIAISYIAINVEMDYLGFPIATGIVPPFYQGHLNTTYMEVELMANLVPLQHSVSTNLTLAIAQGIVSFDVKVSVKVKIIIGSLKSPPFWVHVGCVVEISPPSAPGGGALLSKTCKVKP